MADKEYRVIHFDLSTRKLKKLYPGMDYHQAYKDIQKFLENNGFEHHQWSGYISKEPLTPLEVSDCSTRLLVDHPWIRPCAKKMNASIVPKDNFDLLQNFDENLQRNPRLRERFMENFHQMLVERRERQKRRPMREVFAEAQKAADEYNAKLGIRPSSRDDLEL